MTHKGCDGIMYLDADLDECWGWIIMPVCTKHGGPIIDSEIDDVPSASLQEAK